MASKSGLDNVLQSILSVINKEQNQAYPPSVFSDHYNATTAFLIDKLVEIYPMNVDMLLPFIVSIKLPIKSGEIELPTDYRNLLNASISVKPDGSDCSDAPIENDTQMKAAALKGGCKTRPIDIVSWSQWDYRTTSTYDYPTLDNPIGVFKGGKIKVCPYDLTKIEFTYVKRENLYVYGYILQPDDTYIFDPKTSEESQWNDTAFQPLFKGCLALASAYLRDNQLGEFSKVLNQVSLF